MAKAPARTDRVTLNALLTSGRLTGAEQRVFQGWYDDLMNGMKIGLTPKGAPLGRLRVRQAQARGHPIREAQGSPRAHHEGNWKPSRPDASSAQAPCPHLNHGPTKQTARPSVAAGVMMNMGKSVQQGSIQWHGNHRGVRAIGTITIGSYPSGEPLLDFPRDA